MVLVKELISFSIVFRTKLIENGHMLSTFIYTDHQIGSREAVLGIIWSWWIISHHYTIDAHDF